MTRDEAVTKALEEISQSQKDAIGSVYDEGVLSVPPVHDGGGFSQEQVDLMIAQALAPVQEELQQAKDQAVVDVQAAKDEAQKAFEEDEAKDAAELQGVIDQAKADHDDLQAKLAEAIAAIDQAKAEGVEAVKALSERAGAIRESFEKLISNLQS